MKHLLLLLCLLGTANLASGQIGFINEFHYDNVGTDENEFVEVALATTANPADYAILLYNGNGGVVYDTKNLLTGNGCQTNGTESNGYRIYYCDYPVNGIQNGPPDGIALVNQTDEILIDFISYEGTIEATDGIAMGVTSIDVGVVEPLPANLGGSVGGSIQRYGRVEDNTWDALGTHTKGFVNSNQGDLPVELTSFSAVASAEGAVLRWMTAGETNNAGFDVQQQVGAAWRSLGFVAGHGTTVEARQYAFEVRNLAAGTYRFRLQQVDFDGAFEFSPEVELTVASAGPFLLTHASPNPAREQASFTLSVQRSQQVTADLYNVLGQRVATLLDARLADNESRQITLDAATLPAGVYVYRVQGETFAGSGQLTVVH